MKCYRGFLLLLSSLLCLIFLSSCFSFRNADGVPVPDDAISSVPSSDVASQRKSIAYRPSPSNASPADVLLPSAPSLSVTSPYIGVSVSLIAAGDNLIHPNIYIDAHNRQTPDKAYDFLPMYTDIADRITEADIAFINQETVMAGEAYGYSGWPCFNAPQQLGDDLVTLGFDVINIANNHMLDMGTQGLLDTIDYWHSKPVTLLGGYTDAADASDIRVTECQDIRIAWLSYTYATNGIQKAAWSDAVIPYIDDELLLSDLSNAREAADFVIVSIHWGEENTQTPTAEQRRLASLLAENGADLILGHHSHTVQPIEWIDAGDKKVLCVYSLGNFVSGMARPVNVVGGLLSLDIVPDGKDGLTVDHVLFSPTVFYYGMDWYGTHIYRMQDFTEELASTHGTIGEGYAFSLEKAESIITDVISPEFLPNDFKN